MLSTMQKIICLHNCRILKSLSHSNLKLEVNELFKKVRKNVADFRKYFIKCWTLNSSKV